LNRHMIGKMILSILCFLIFSMLFAFAEEYAFRQTKWGITKEEVENSEYSKLIGDYEDKNYGAQSIISVSSSQLRMQDMYIILLKKY